MYYFDEISEVKDYLPKRDAGGNKGTFGKVLVVAGSYRMAGAAVLAARACYRAGAGMVRVISDERNREIVQQALPEALFGAHEDLEAGLKWADVVLLGPGIGQGKEALEQVNRVLDAWIGPLVLDADAINLLAKSEIIYTKMVKKSRDFVDFRVVLTPHPGELSRLLGISTEELKEASWIRANEYAVKTGTVVVAKDARTFVCDSFHDIFLNIHGNDGMATAGSGDVLAGIIAALIAQDRKQDVYNACVAGVTIHAFAGECACETVGTSGCMAGDIADAVGAVMSRI